MVFFYIIRNRLTIVNVLEFNGIISSSAVFLKVHVKSPLAPSLYAFLKIKRKVCIEDKARNFHIRDCMLRHFSSDKESEKPVGNWGYFMQMFNS